MGSPCSFRQLLLFKTGNNILAIDFASSTMLLARFANTSTALPIALFRSSILVPPALNVSLANTVVLKILPTNKMNHDTYQFEIVFSLL